MADYNGVTLPDIPENIKSLYPYWFVCQMTISQLTPPNAYYIYGSTSPSYTFQDGEHLRHKFSDTSVYYVTNYVVEGGTEWESDWNEVPTANIYSPSLNETSGYKIIWSNHDILSGSPTSTEVYFEANDVRYYYNGYIFPPLPSGTIEEVNISDFPYALIFSAEGNTALIFLTEPAYYVSSDKTIVNKADMSCLMFALNGNFWKAAGLDEIPANGLPLPLDYVLWHGFDILDGETNELYKSGSEVLPDNTRVSITIRTLCKIGDAIREVLGIAERMNPDDIDFLIKAIPTTTSTETTT